jgi:elongation factor P hydroxylase
MNLATQYTGPPDHSGSSLITLDKAVNAHRQWKATFQAAAANRETLDVETIQRDDCCDLGKWLTSDGRRLYGNRPEFTNLVTKHSAFHSIAGVVAGFINDGAQDAARSHLRGGSQFAFASTEVSVAITLLKAQVVHTPDGA